MLAHGHRQAWFGQNTLHQLLHCGIQQLGLGNPVHQALLEGLLGTDEVTREQHLKSGFTTQVARQGDTGRGTKQAKLDAADRKARAAGSHGEVAHGDQLAARRSGNALHPGNHRYRQALQSQHHISAFCKQRLVVSQ